VDRQTASPAELRETPSAIKSDYRAIIKPHSKQRQFGSQAPHRDGAHFHVLWGRVIWKSKESTTDFTDETDKKKKDKDKGRSRGRVTRHRGTSNATSFLYP
jgi:hypothetical protein